MNTSYREPLLCMIVLSLVIFEIPFLNLFLVLSLFMLMCYTFVYRRPLLANGEMLILLLFIALYFLNDSNLEQSNTYKLWYVISAVSLYECGYNMPFEQFDKALRSRKLNFVIKVIACAYTAYILVTILYSASKGQFAISRNPLNLWTGTLRAATHYGTMTIIPLSYGLTLFVVGNTKNEKRTGILFLLFSILVTVITASRTVLFLIPIGAIIAYFGNIKMQGSFSSKHLRQLFGSLVLLGIGAVAFVMNLFGVQTFFFRTNLGQRYLLGYAPTLLNDGRWRNTVFFFKNIEKCIWGGGYARIHSGNLHNVYLNVFDLSGIIPFALLILFTICVVIDYKRIKRNASVETSTQLLLILILFLSFIQMLLEPTMESVPVFMWCLLLICGMQNKVSHCYE